MILGIRKKIGPLKLEEVFLFGIFSCRFGHTGRHDF